MTIIAENRKARYDYNILETIDAGIELKGFEVKAVKNGRINLAGSYAVIRGGEAWLLNADIPAYQPANAPPDYDPQRTRRLLLKKSEIKSLVGRLHEKGLTLAPLKVYIKNASAGSARGRIKLEIGLAKSRKKADKRELIRQRETKREIMKRTGM
ncbi:MAG: SsrA-binding protein SmpB [Patescibacteria group bacterium]